MTDAPTGAAAAQPEPWLEVTCSRNFTAWLAEQGVSLACTTYQTGKLMLFGRKANGEHRRPRDVDVLRWRIACFADARTRNQFVPNPTRKQS